MVTLRFEQHGPVRLGQRGWDGASGRRAPTADPHGLRAGARQGDKHRRVPLTGATAEAVEEWPPVEGDGPARYDRRPEAVEAMRYPYILGCGASLIMVASLEKVDPIIPHQVDQAMLLRDTP